MANGAYKKLHALSKKTALLQSVGTLLDWDQEVLMPKEGISFRSEQIELLASLAHKDKTSKSFAKSLFSLIDQETGEIIDSNLSARQVAALKRWRRDYLQAVKLPQGFVKQFARTTSMATHVWKTAKDHNDFRSFAPHLEKIISLSRKKADLLGFHEHPYDALLDLYEPEIKTSRLVPLFDKLKLFLKQFLKEIAIKTPFPDQCLYQNCCPKEQLEFARKILHKMGFHSTSSRLDLSVHPMCTGLNPLDTRMTTKVHPENIMMNLGAVLHEGGHGLYNMHLPAEEYGSPLCESASMAIDESQSRLWETFLGQSESLWLYFFPLLQKDFPTQFGNVSFSEFFHAINSVKPGLIRIDADEVSYNLHIILRFEIEKGLMENTIKVKEIPDLWNEKMRDYLGVNPEFDGQGCLQDIHWSLGFIGYFPSYTLGNLYAAQFLQTMEKKLPHWQESFQQGDFSSVRDFFKENIHRHGREFLPEELCTRITGHPLSEEPYIEYLKKKYSKLYENKEPGK